MDRSHNGEHIRFLFLGRLSQALQLPRIPIGVLPCSRGQSSDLAALLIRRLLVRFLPGREFSRHSEVATVMIYDDNRKDVVGDVARLVAGE